MGVEMGWEEEFWWLGVGGGEAVHHTGGRLSCYQ